MNYLEYKVWFCSQREYHKFAIIDYHTTITDDNSVYSYVNPSNSTQILELYNIDTQYNLETSAAAILPFTMDYSLIDLIDTYYFDAICVTLYPIKAIRYDKLYVKHYTYAHLSITISAENYLQTVNISTYSNVTANISLPNATALSSNVEIYTEYLLDAHEGVSSKTSHQSLDYLQTYYSLEGIMISTVINNTLTNLQNFSLDDLESNNSSLLVVTHAIKFNK